VLEVCVGSRLNRGKIRRGLLAAVPCRGAQGKQRDRETDGRNEDQAADHGGAPLLV
jgi:hypothetical protein